MHKILFRYSHSYTEHWKSVSYCKRGNQIDLNKIKIEPKYPSCRLIKKAKAVDLKKLCMFLPPAVAFFYRNIQHDEDPCTSNHEEINLEFDADTTAQEKRVEEE